MKSRITTGAVLDSQATPVIQNENVGKSEHVQRQPPLHGWIFPMTWNEDSCALLLSCVSAGHFTQVVWKDSTQLGLGMATNGNKVYVVGQYRPAGNINTREYFEKNVCPLGNKSGLCSALSKRVKFIFPSDLRWDSGWSSAKFELNTSTRSLGIPSIYVLSLRLFFKEMEKTPFLCIVVVGFSV